MQDGESSGYSLVCQHTKIKSSKSSHSICYWSIKARFSLFQTKQNEFEKTETILDI